MNRTNILAAVVVFSLAIGWVVGRHTAGPVPGVTREAQRAKSGNLNAVSPGPEPASARASAAGGVVTAQAFFGSDCEQALAGALDRARDEVLVAIYSLTRRSVSSALARAAQRGVKVSVRYDERSADEGRDMPETIAFLRRRGVRCEAVGFGDSRARMHHKFTVVDRRFVLTGSYNYTTTATEQNRENLVVIESGALADAYAKEFAGLLTR